MNWRNKYCLGLTSNETAAILALSGRGEACEEVRRTYAEAASNHSAIRLYFDPRKPNAHIGSFFQARLMLTTSDVEPANEVGR